MASAYSSEPAAIVIRITLTVLRGTHLMIFKSLLLRQASMETSLTPVKRSQLKHQKEVSSPLLPHLLGLHLKSASEDNLNSYYILFYNFCASSLASAFPH